MRFFLFFIPFLLFVSIYAEDYSKERLEKIVKPINSSKCNQEGSNFNELINEYITHSEIMFDLIEKKINYNVKIYTSCVNMNKVGCFDSYLASSKKTFDLKNKLDQRLFFFVEKKENFSKLLVSLSLHENLLYLFGSHNISDCSDENNPFL